MSHKLVIVIAACWLFDLVAAQTSGASAVASSLSSECVALISAHPPTVSMYASEVCQVCQNLNISPSVEPCCSNSNPTACFASSFYGVTVTDATQSAPITIAGANFTGSANCEAFDSIIASCEAATPGFTNLCFHDLQSCLCSTSGTWAPTYYDNYYSRCLAWASTASPAEYSLLGPSTNGVITQSRPCETWAALTATGGTPSNCATSSSNSLTSTALASTGSTGIARPSSSASTSSTGSASVGSSSSAGNAVEARKPEGQMFAVVVIMQIITVYVVLA